ncbi:MAG: hypothetical protein JXR03_01315 [Cyclobacteriaceae bacterium]
MKHFFACIIFVFASSAFAQDWVVAYQNSVDYYENFESEKARDEALAALESYRQTVAEEDKNLSAILRQLSVVYYDLDELDQGLDHAMQEVACRFWED